MKNKSLELVRGLYDAVKHLIQEGQESVTLNPSTDKKLLRRIHSILEEIKLGEYFWVICDTRDPQFSGCDQGGIIEGLEECVSLNFSGVDF